MSRIHVIGAGLAGLSTAVELTRRGASVTLYEAAPVAGGRCRSFHDEKLDTEIDNGGHVLLGANRSALAFLRLTGGIDALTEIAPAEFPFLDLSDATTWSIRPNRSVLPWWVLSPSRRVPGTAARDYAGLMRLFFAGPDATVADCLVPGARLTDLLWTPLTTAVMNAAPANAAAQPLARVLRESFLHGETACRPFIARRGLSQAFAEPALRYIATRTAIDYRSGYRLAVIERNDTAVSALRFDEERVALAAEDRVVLAVPPHVASDLLPTLAVPLGSTAIINAHFHLDQPAELPGGQPLLGLTGGTAQWLIARDDIVSVTVSAADDLVARPADELLATLWHDTAHALRLPETSVPPARLIKERRATFAQTPGNQHRRPRAATAWRNLFLAGDWTDTGLPATIEGAIRSGLTAATAAIA